MDDNIFAQKGWICPKCGRVLAPSTMYCLWCCNDMKEAITTTGTPIPKWDPSSITVSSVMVDSSAKTDCSWSKPNDEPQTEDEILNEQVRAFMGMVEQTKRSK